MKFAISIFTILCLFSCAAALGRGNAERQNTETITGRVVVFGNEPRTFTGIEDENGIQYAIYPPAIENELRRLQGHLIEFAVVFVEEQTYGSLFLRGGTVTPISWRIIR